MTNTSFTQSMFVWDFGFGSLVGVVTVGEPWVIFSWSNSEVKHCYILIVVVRMFTIQTEETTIAGLDSSPVH